MARGENLGTLTDQASFTTRRAGERGNRSLPLTGLGKGLENPEIVAAPLCRISARNARKRAKPPPSRIPGASTEGRIETRRSRKISHKTETRQKEGPLARPGSHRRRQNRNERPEKKDRTKRNHDRRSVIGNPQKTTRGFHPSPYRSWSQTGKNAQIPRG